VKDTYNLDRLAVAAGAAALRDGATMRENVGKIRRTREKLSEELGKIGFDVLPSSANFVFARLGTADRARATYRALRERGILVRYFDRPLLDDGLRITVGTDEEISTLLTAIREAT
jgi:histidinol-phosphate aminotransferase